MSRRTRSKQIVPPSEPESEDEEEQLSCDYEEEEDNDDLASAKQQLHPTARPASLPCREEEFDDILHYLTSAIQSGDGCCICKALLL